MSRCGSVYTCRKAQPIQKSKMVIKKKLIENRDDRKITEFCQIRRSNRKTSQRLQMEKLDKTLQLIDTGYNEDFLRIYESDLKGRGLRAGCSFEKEAFVVEYKGELLNYAEARLREKMYAQDSKIGSYMYYFEHQNKRYCVDATAETKFKGRLVNHSLLNPNLKSKVIDGNGTIHLCLFAKRDIRIGEELLYDYGDRSSASIALNPWLKS
ncbi:[Histone H4]-lysine(20) N-methyltransferase [Aphelenchoides besseyi]|nr:[Histone H4]-lysine(20) N-methyltransferase [Aphelenchoides besseyi]KAI6201453.1 [Histone H4]-lysine(20) N-methyltransferase [Aphelenchoides besseyi]